MSTIATPSVQAKFTPDDLLRLPDAVNYELVDGKLVERHMGMESSRVGLCVGSLLVSFCRQTRAGLVFTTDAGYQCFADEPDKVRKPDVSVVLKGRFPGDKAPEGFSRIPPDLAVEVISPNDLAYEVDEKVAEYLSAGVRLVWVVNPILHIVRVHRPVGAVAGPLSQFSAGDTITGEDVLPGFSSPVAAFFESL